MSIVDPLKSLFDDKGYFIVRDASFGAAGAVVSGVFLKKYISVHPPVNGAIYMLVYIITQHITNRLMGGEKDIQKTSFPRQIASVISGRLVAQRVVASHGGEWTFISSLIISSLAKGLLLGNDC